MARFLITGLPRSRTAWFSVAATTPTSLCMHEPTSGILSFADLIAHWGTGNGFDIGISDSALAFQLGRILKEVQPRTVIVFRPMVEVKASLATWAAKMGVPVDSDLGDAYLEQSATILEKWRNHPLVRAADYASLENEDHVRGLLGWLLPGREFPRLHPLMGMNIQVTRKHLIERLIPHNGWHLKDPE